MTSSQLWDAEDAARYAESSSEMYAPEVLSPTLDFLERRAGPSGDRSALELAIGTGRVGVPLRRRGVAVQGIELSPHMVAELRRTADEQELPVVVGDMATTVVAGEFALVYLVFNTLANLRTQAEQVQCFRNAARHLRSGGLFVIEIWVPPLRRLPPGQLAAPFDVTEQHPGLGHLRPGHPARHVAPLHARGRRVVSPRGVTVPLRVALRVRPDGPAGRTGTARTLRRLGREPLHL